MGRGSGSCSSGRRRATGRITCSNNDGCSRAASPRCGNTRTAQDPQDLATPQRGPRSAQQPPETPSRQPPCASLTHPVALCLQQRRQGMPGQDSVGEEDLVPCGLLPPELQGPLLLLTRCVCCAACGAVPTVRSPASGGQVGRGGWGSRALQSYPAAAPQACRQHVLPLKAALEVCVGGVRGDPWGDRRWDRRWDKRWEGGWVRGWDRG